MDKDRRVIPIALSAALLLMSGSAHAVYQDWAVNGGFETSDFTGWTQFPGSLGAGGQTIITPGNTGTYAANLNEPAPAANIIKQANLRAGAWTPGQTIDISLDYRGSAGAGGVLFIELFNELDGGGADPSSPGILLAQGAPTGDWQNFSWSGVVGPTEASIAGGITLQINAVCGAGAGCFSSFDIDNVQIFADLAPIPVPAAAWLFGSALGLLGWARRKQTTV